MTRLNADSRGPGIIPRPGRGLLSRTWLATTDYTWLPRFLDTRGLTRPGRVIIASWCFVFALMAATMQLSNLGADSGLARSVLTVSALSGLYGGVSWSRHATWPNWAQSMTFVVWSDVWLALALLIGVRSAFVGTIGCILFIMIGFYVAVVHSPRVAVAHIGGALVICSLLARSALTDPSNDDWIVFDMYVIICGVIITTAWALQVVWLRLTDDARRAGRDYLTATLNRRGLQDEARQLLRGDPSHSKALVAMLIDVDSFKRLNDTHGHGAGDDALTAIAERLVRAAGPEGVVARIGGDEFVVLRSVDATDIETVAAQIHSAISSTSDLFPVSASTGVSVYLTTAADLPGSAVNMLIEHADNAMYRAKKRGGNRIAWAHMSQH
ncbi:GGDEF domain-containing protein [Rhodococcus sp. IEGM 1379]|uniref:GGDEF domain-containing protein n=1 Tax=Rhodococcus sp. IEGM 1379 TaxID=3047086 RepID=UPI0024B815BB|nr:GGDEF domain-containing protein [Rhodococcus sp. IEGM 1379]MDI9915183.1 GGDEF domain-containing protein [Rhodococcus sp. IEGM 1379]